MRSEPRAKLSAPPSDYFDGLYCDTIVHARAAPEFLVAVRGVERVVLGSDYPFDMVAPDCVRHLRELSIDAAAKAKTLNGVAMGLLRSPPRHPRLVPGKASARGRSVHAAIGRPAGAPSRIPGNGRCIEQVGRVGGIR